MIRAKKKTIEHGLDRFCFNLSDVTSDFKAELFVQ